MDNDYHKLGDSLQESGKFDDEIARLSQNPAYIIDEEPGNYLARGRYSNPK